MSEPSGQSKPTQKLCQNQVENLLKAMASVDGETRGQANRRPLNAADPSKDQLQLPEVDADLLAGARWLHESAAREIAETLGAMLRTPVEVSVADLGTTCLDTFQTQAQDHCWHSVLSPDASVGDWHLDVTPELCCVMVDRLLGGDPTAGETFTRPMTEIERRLMARVVDSTIEILQRTWQQVAKIDWLVRHQNLTAKLSSRDPMLQIRFAVALSRNQGSIRLCIPLATIESFREQLCDHSWQLDSTPGGGPHRMARNVAGAPIEVVATVARSTIRTGDLLDLGVGDIIATEKGVDQPLELTIQGVPKFKIRAGSLKGNKAIQIEDSLDPPERRPPPSVVPIKKTQP